MFSVIVQLNVGVAGQHGQAVTIAVVAQGSRPPPEAASPLLLAPLGEAAVRGPAAGPSPVTGLTVRTAAPPDLAAVLVRLDSKEHAVNSVSTFLLLGTTYILLIYKWGMVKYF